MDKVRADIQIVNDPVDGECWVCRAEIRNHQTYCSGCIAADRRRCFYCRAEYRCDRDYVGCQICEPRPPRALTLPERICQGLEDDSQPIRRVLRTTAQWQAEGLPKSTLRQLELGLLTAAHRLLSVRRCLEGLRGETRRVVLDCLGRVVNEEASAAYNGENEIRRLAAMDAAS